MGIDELLREKREDILQIAAKHGAYPSFVTFRVKQVVDKLNYPEAKPGLN